MKSQTDIPYCGELSTAAQYLDLHLPESGDAKAWVGWFHGGGLAEGDAKSDLPVFEFLTERGYAVASINYTLYPETTYKNLAHEARSSLLYLHQRTQELGLGERYALAGHSAGAYLSLLAALHEDWRGARPAPDAIFAISGQCFTHYAVRKEFYGSEQPVRVDERSPLFHAYKGQPPLFLACGGEDIPGRIEENACLHAQALIHEAESEAHVVPGKDHCGVLYDGIGIEPETAKLLEPFLARHLG